MTAADARQQHLPTPVAETQRAAPEIAHPALWKIARGDAVIYLFGTVHVLPQGVQWYDGPIADAFEHSALLVTEIIDKSPAEMRAIINADAMLPAGQSLRAVLRPADARALSAAALRYHLPADGFDRFQPWYAAVALSTLPLLRSGYDPANGVDAQLSARAKAMAHGHEALETPEQQLGLFAGLPMAAQKRYLHDVMHDLPQLTRELGGVITEWKRGNAVRLARLMNADEDDPLLRKKLLLDRNAAWAVAIRDRLTRPGTTFIAVGAGHLAGMGSVQDDLQAMGIAVTRVQ